MAKYNENGGIIGPATVPTGNFGSAPGVWKLAEVEKYIREGIWPVATTGFQVANSCRFNSASADSLTRTTSGAGTSNTTFTISLWIKKSSNASAVPRLLEFYNNSSYYVSLRFRDDVASNLDFYSESNGSGVNLRTNRSFRDLSSWYHIVMRVDTTESTADDRLRMYVNGVQETSFAARTNPSSSENLQFNGSGDTQLVSQSGSDTANDRRFNGYMAEVVFLDGQSLGPTSFGETDSTTNNWVPKDVSGLTFGNNGFYLPFQNASALGQDDSGNGNNFTVNNITSIDQCVDNCTNNFSTLNALVRNATGATLTISEGNLQSYSASTSVFGGFSSTLGVSSGKWYWEVKLVSTTAGSFYTAVGVTSENYINFVSSASRTTYMSGSGIASRGETWQYKADNGNKQHDGTATAYGDSMTTGDIAGLALDLDNNYIYFSKNGTFQNAGDPTSGSSGTGAAFSLDAGLTYFPIIDQYHTNTTAINFGNAPYSISSGNTDYSGLGDFEYEVPSGYRALCTKNIGLVG